MTARGRSWAILALMLAALALCVQVSVGRIESDLLARAQTALATAGVSFYGVAVDGRDLLLQGRVRSQEEASRIRAIAVGLEGVRRVHDQMVVEGAGEVSSVPPGMTSGSAPARLRLQRLGERVFLSGMLPADGSEERVVRAALRRFGDGNVTNSLESREGVAHAEWLDASDRLVELLALAPDNARVVLEGSIGILVGDVSRPADVDRLGDLAAAVAGVDWRFDLSSRSPDPDGMGGDR